jgi:hypothetical protein
VFFLTAARIHCKKYYALTKFFLCIKHEDDIVRTGAPGSSPSTTTSAPDCGQDCTTHGRAPRRQTGPRVEHQPCPASSTGHQLLPPSPYQRPANRHGRVRTPPSGPATSTGASFLSTLGMWRQGCGKYLFPHQSPLSAAEFPRH